MSDHLEAVEKEEAAQFFDEFVDTLATFSGAAVAMRYQEPFTAIDSEGTSLVLSTREETGIYFQKFLDEYRSTGCSSCRYENLQLVTIGA